MKEPSLSGSLDDDALAFDNHELGYRHLVDDRWHLPDARGGASSYLDPPTRPVGESGVLNQRGGRRRLCRSRHGCVACSDAC